MASTIGPPPTLPPQPTAFPHTMPAPPQTPPVPPGSGATTGLETTPVAPPITSSPPPSTPMPTSTTTGALVTTAASIVAGDGDSNSNTLKIALSVTFALLLVGIGLFCLAKKIRHNRRVRALDNIEMMSMAPALSVPQGVQRSSTFELPSLPCLGRTHDSKNDPQGEQRQSLLRATVSHNGDDRV